MGRLSTRMFTSLDTYQPTSRHTGWAYLSVEKVHLYSCTYTYTHITYTMSCIYMPSCEHYPILSHCLPQELKTVMFSPYKICRHVRLVDVMTTSKFIAPPHSPHQTSTIVPTVKACGCDKMLYIMCTLGNSAKAFGNCHAHVPLVCIASCQVLRERSCRIQNRHK